MDAKYTEDGETIQYSDGRHRMTDDENTPQTDERLKEFLFYKVFTESKHTFYFNHSKTNEDGLHVLYGAYEHSGDWNTAMPPCEITLYSEPEFVVKLARPILPAYYAEPAEKPF